MSKAFDPDRLTLAIEKDFADFCHKKGESGADVLVSVEQIDSDAVIKFLYSEEASHDVTVKPYASKLKKQFGFLSDGEGEELAVDLVVPVARAREMADALNNPQAKVSKAFNTVVFTGTLTVGRAEAIEAAEQANFKVADSVSKGVDYVVAGDKPGTKADKAAALGIPVLNEVEWNRLRRKNAPKR